MDRQTDSSLRGFSRSNLTSDFKFFGLPRRSFRSPRKDEKNIRFLTPHSALFTQKAFTLSEVLITLGIIGVVAAFTIPNLVKNYQDLQYKTAYKNTFSVASQALITANKDNLLSSPTGEGDNTAHLNNFQAFMTQFKISKKCTNNDNGNCWDNTGEKFLNPDYPRSSSYAFIDDSGTAWSMYYSGYCIIFVDTNSATKPNQWGKDRFVLLLQSAKGTSASGLPVKVIPLADNHIYVTMFLCKSPNKCATEQNYFGTSWLYK